MCSKGQSHLAETSSSVDMQKMCVNVGDCEKKKTHTNSNDDIFGVTVGLFVHLAHLLDVQQSVHKHFLYFAHRKFAPCHVVSLSSGKKKNKQKKSPHIYRVRFSPIRCNTGQREDCAFKSHPMSFSPRVGPKASTWF